MQHLNTQFPAWEPEKHSKIVQWYQKLAHLGIQKNTILFCLPSDNFRLYTNKLGPILGPDVSLLGYEIHKGLHEKIHKDAPDNFNLVRGNILDPNRVNATLSNLYADKQISVLELDLTCAATDVTTIRIQQLLDFLHQKMFLSSRFMLITNLATCIPRVEEFRTLAMWYEANQVHLSWLRDYLGLDVEFQETHHYKGLGRHCKMGLSCFICHYPGAKE